MILATLATGNFLHASGQCFLRIDVGGTFADFVLSVPSRNKLLVHKPPSIPNAPHRAIVDGVERLLRETGIDPGAVRCLTHGTTEGFRNDRALSCQAGAAT